MKGLLSFWQQAIIGTYPNHTNLVHTHLSYCLKISIISTVLSDTLLVSKIISFIKTTNKIFTHFSSLMDILSLSSIISSRLHYCANNKNDKSLKFFSFLLLLPIRLIEKMYLLSISYHCSDIFWIWIFNYYVYETF